MATTQCAGEWYGPVRTGSISSARLVTASSRGTVFLPVFSVDFGLIFSFNFGHIFFSHFLIHFLNQIWIFFLCHFWFQ